MRASLSFSTPSPPSSPPSAMQIADALVACAPGWINPPGSDYCYRGYTTSMQWTAGNSFCNSQSPFNTIGYLASIRNEAEGVHVATNMCGSQLTARAFFIGLNDRANEAGNDRSSGNYVWSSGASNGFIRSSSTGHKFWERDEPNNSRGWCVPVWPFDCTQDCIAVGSGRYTWFSLDDFDCDASLPVCCEYAGEQYSASPTAGPTPPGTPAPTPPGTPAPTVALTPTRTPSTWTPTPIPTAGGAPSFLSYLTGRQYWFLDVWGSNVSEAMYHKR